LRLIIAFLLIFAALSPAGAQESAVWSRSGDRITLIRSGISFPARAGTLSITETKEFSHPGQSLDAIAQYRSADSKVVGTVYVYYPGIAHSGLAALATDEAIRLNSRNPVTSHGSQVVAAGGHRGVAIRTDYGAYMGNNASSAAFVKAGRWMVKIRVSAPEGRKSEVTGAMEALLDQIRFSGAAAPRPAAIIGTPACPSAATRDAGLLPDVAAETAANAIVIGTTDAAGGVGSDENPARALPSRIGTKWCRHVVAVGNSKVPVLRATDAASAGAAMEGKSLLFALYSDAGGALEVMRVAKSDKYLLLNHEIGATNLLGTFDAVPSDRQIADLLAGRSEAGAPRARVLLKADGNTDVHIQAPPPTPASPTT
jgi:hypothetical protein